jgi:hypothetical protein
MNGRGLPPGGGMPDLVSAEPASRFDASVAHPSRVYDYWLGGKTNFAADREAGDQVIAVRPGIITDIRANRDFLLRSVRYLAAECGIRQFLDIGTGIPTYPNVHEVAQDVAPGCRIVYVDNDPLALTHARALLTSSPEGATVYLDADLRAPDQIITAAARSLDFRAPVAVLLVGMLHLIADDERPHDIVAHLMSQIPPGSYLGVCHPASDILADVVAEGARRYNQLVSIKQTRRDRGAVSRFFAGLELAGPGIVQPQQWPAPASAALSEDVSAWAGVARKP